MPALKDAAVLALAARLLGRPLDGPELAGRFGEQPDDGAGPAEDRIAPLLEQCLKALEDSSLPGLSADATIDGAGNAGVLLENLAARLHAMEKQAG